MNYIVIDLEFNQYFDFPNEPKMTPEPRCPFEIIQIGAVKLDGDMQELDRKSFMVQPQIYGRMHPFVEKITGIKMSDLAGAPVFEAVYEAFVAFIGVGKATLCVWGASDVKALYRNILFYNLNNKLLTRKYINVQELASNHLKHPSNHSVGLKSAVEALGLDASNQFHDALNDAAYTAEIFQIIRIPNIRVQTFNLSQMKQRTAAKATALNIGLLFAYAEKQLGRKLTDKEKEIVIDIYNAGQRHQFDMSDAE